MFLVGDAPPTDYADDREWTDTCAEAARRGITVNAVQCGAIDGTAEAWRKIAQAAEGAFLALPQDGGMERDPDTPFDGELAAAQSALDATVLHYGTREAQAVSGGLFATAATAPAETQLARARYNALSDRITAAGDLIDDLRSGKLAEVTQVRDEELPEALKPLSADKRAAKLKEIGQQRADLRTRVAALAEQRAGWLRAQAATQPAAERDGFDQQVAELVRTQRARQASPR